MVFDLPVTGDKVKPQQVTALHLFSGLAFVGTGAIICIYNYEIPEWGAVILGIGVLLLWLTMFRNKWITGKPINRIIRYAELMVSLSIAALSFYEQWKFPSGIFSVLSAAIVFSIYWERDAGQQLYIQIDDKGVRMPITSRTRFIAWHEIEQVLLKYGVLSVDCIDNKLIQVDVSKNTIDEQDFNDFCKQQVEDNKNKRINNDW